MDWWNALVEAGENFVDNASDAIGDARNVARLHGDRP